jgi:8-oxo-dGTP pyrophosphatase MutT (NUDIX family)
VHLLLRREASLLLSKRYNTGYADGLWNAVSGHLEEGETVVEALIREAREEIAITIDPTDVYCAVVLQHHSPSGSTRIGWFFEVTRWSGGEPSNAEPRKCAGVAWFPMDDLPKEIVGYFHAALECYRREIPFAIHWQKETSSVVHALDQIEECVSIPSDFRGNCRLAAQSCIEHGDGIARLRSNDGSMPRPGSWVRAACM